MVSWSIEPDRTALLLLDPCDMFFEGPLASQNNDIVVCRLHIFADLCRARDIPVVATGRPVSPDRGLHLERFVNRKRICMTTTLKASAPCTTDTRSADSRESDTP